MRIMQAIASSYGKWEGVWKKGERETNIELAASESFKDVHHLDTDAARPPCFDLSSFVKKIALLSQFEHGKIARYYGADKLEMTWCVLPVKLAVTLHQSWSTLMIIANWNFLKGKGLITIERNDHNEISRKEESRLVEMISRTMEQNEYRSITHGVGIILKEKRPSVRGKDHFVDDTLGKCCVKINDLKDGERHEMWLLLELIVSTLITTQSEKDTTLAYYHRIHGNKWAEIAKHLPGRGGSISWASKKQTCINGSTMKCEFVAFAAVGKEAEWLRNMIHEILI
ncbi:hypothetical protein Tco_0751474 [Tanacetum coccineum]|uniref:Uncharacterized protein n=1 Tax=Tanacetum coccineum TaxID=301880 RepID=A0ABQ4Z7M6_9ASTR